MSRLKRIARIVASKDLVKAFGFALYIWIHLAVLGLAALQLFDMYLALR